MAGDEGIPFMKSNEGIIRLLIIVLGALAFIMIAVAGYTGIITWVLSAYIVSWILSLQTYFFIATKVASHMKCGIIFDDVDICLSVFSFFNCLMASIVLAIFAASTTLWIVADVLGFVVSLLYAVELCLLRENPPLNLKYLITRNGLIKASIFVVGCSAFVLLHVGVYSPCTDTTVAGCDIARTWVFVTYIYCWALSAILLFLRLIKVSSKMAYFEHFDMLWSLLSFINYLVASIVLVNFLQCTTFADFSCGTRLASVIFGFYVALLYLVDVILLKRKFGRILDKNVFTPKPNEQKSKKNVRINVAS